MGDDDVTPLDLPPPSKVGDADRQQRAPTEPGAFDEMDASATGTVSPTPRAAPRMNFAEQIVQSGRHPILLFGTAESGKSTLLVSLINFMSRNENRINIALGDRIFGRTDVEAERLYQRAIEFYERYTRDFAQGAQLPSTGVEKPFFIPIDLRPATGPAVRLAFLEGNGEWIRPLSGTAGALYQELKPEIVDILKHFGSSVSIIYVAPYTVADGSTAESDTGLHGAIMKYEVSRNLPERDCHLFLLTKWDAFAQPLRDDPKFKNIDEVEVTQIIGTGFPQSWHRFRNLPIRPNAGKRFFMPYAAGLITGGLVRQPPPQHRETFDRYPKTLWNWLYQNAVNAVADNKAAAVLRLSPLFPDVLAADAPPLSLSARLAGMFGR